jgi:very-short-patch-repair endonuclease
MRTRKKYECPLCGALWDRITARMQQGKTCSNRCSSIKGYLAGSHKVTDIEEKLHELLHSMKLDFSTQKPILGVTVADVFIEPNVAIFADGEYWHTGGMKEYKDKEKTKRLVKNGYVVLRLSGKELLEKIDEVKKKVTEAYEKRKIKKEL